MIAKCFQRLRSQSGSVTAEAALSISMIVVAGFCMVQVFGFAFQYQRLQTLAQESSRAAASLADPIILEKEVSDLVESAGKDISLDFDWQPNLVSVKLTEPTFGVIKFFTDSLEVSATAPRWSG